MKTKYAVLHPVKGKYIYVSNETLIETLVQTMYETYMAQTHDALYAQVQLNIDGSETWKNPQGEEIIRTVSIDNLNQLLTKKIMGVTIL
jgi:hypothetical protein